MEGLTLSRLAPAVLADLEAKQFATPGNSAEQGIAYILHLVLQSSTAAIALPDCFLLISQRLLT